MAHWASVPEMLDVEVFGIAVVGVCHFVSLAGSHTESGQQGEKEVVKRRASLGYQKYHSPSDACELSCFSSGLWFIGPLHQRIHQRRSHTHTHTNTQTHACTHARTPQYASAVRSRAHEMLQSRKRERTLSALTASKRDTDTDRERDETH